jgi:2-polyprenyl-3-methyl-5-hydroxy-6-metoxy-1,4-benzoquinol methylase
MPRETDPSSFTPAQAAQQHWDAQAATYDHDKARNAVYYDAIKSLVADAVDPQHRERVLDIGCGTGQVLAGLNPREGLGLDLSPRMIEQARRAWAHRPELAFESSQSGREQMAARFTAVICCDVLEHAADWKQLIQTASDASLPGAIIVFTTPNPLWAFPLWMLEKLRLKMPEGWHRYVHRRDFADELRERGCEVARTGTLLMIPAGLFRLGPALSGAAAKLPLLRGLGVIQYVVARKL